MSNDTADVRQIGYRGLHMRLVAARGRASAYPCAGDCGRPAVDWAYDHTDPDELVATHNRTRCTYSLDSNKYLPLCRPCHRRLDLDYRIFSSWNHPPTKGTP